MFRSKDLYLQSSNPSAQIYINVPILLFSDFYQISKFDLRDGVENNHNLRITFIADKGICSRAVTTYRHTDKHAQQTYLAGCEFRFADNLYIFNKMIFAMQQLLCAVLLGTALTVTSVRPSIQLLSVAT